MEDAADKTREQLAEELAQLRRRLAVLEGAEHTAQREAAPTEPKGEERALCEGEELHRLLVESVKDHALFMVGTDGRIASWNAGAQRVFGFREEIVGEHFSALFTPEDARQGAPEEELRRAEAEGQTEDERWHVRKDGSRFWTSGVMTPMRDAEGKTWGFAKVARDITERKRAEEEIWQLNKGLEDRVAEGTAELKAERARLEAVLRQMPSGVIVAEAPSGRLILSNEQVERIWRHPFLRAAEVGQYERYRGFHPEDGRPYAPEEWPLARTVRAGEEVEDEEIDFLRGDGTRGTMLVSSTPVRDRDGWVVAGVAIFEDVTEHKRSEEALRRQADLLDLSHEPIFAWEPSDGIVYWNRGSEELYGFSMEEAVGRNSHELLATVHPVPLERFEAELERDGSWIGELEHTTRDGRRVVVESRHALVRTSDGRRLVLETNRDVTERKRSEEALRRSEERFRATFEQAAVGIAHVNPDGRWLWVNDRLCRIAGYAREELLGMTFQDMTHPDDLEKDLGQLRRLLAGEIDTYSMEKRYLRKGGSVVWVNLTVSLVRDDSGKPGYLISVVEDIADRKRIERELRESEERFRLLVQNSSDVISVFGTEGTVVYQSPSLERVLGRRPEDRIGHNVFEDPLVHPDDLADLRGFFAEARANPGADATAEFRLRHADGSWRHFEAVGRNLIDEPSVAGIVANYRDVTERRRAEEELHGIREAERRRIARDLHDGVLQDLAGALQALQLTRLQARRSGLDLVLGEEIEALRRAAGGLRGAVYDLRSQRERHFGRAVEGLVASERRVALEREVDLSVQEGFPQELPEALGSELLRVVREALTNARKHSGAGRVEVVLSANEGRVQVEVADDGRGFEPGETPGTPGGGGVGLSAMRERVEALGGEIEIKSRPGEGTRVTAKVPF